MKTSPTSLEAQVRNEIDRLHKRNSADYESLLRDVENNRRPVLLNLPQLVASMSQHRFLVLEWGRGTGKTTMRGYRWSRMLNEMPGSTGLFIGPTYQFILTRIIPSMVQGLEMFGIFKDLHYFIGKEPPRSWRKNWKRAFQAPEKIDRYITFWNGTGVHLISQDVPGDGRGLNADWLDTDESALLSGELIQTNNEPSLRGTSSSFRGSPLWGSRFYSSSTPLTPEGQWLIDFEEKAKKDPKTYGFISATCEHNLHNLRPEYLKEAEENAYSTWIFNAEYRNIRPNFVRNSFYSMLDIKRHTYTGAYNYSHYNDVGASVDCRGDGDLVRGVPLILGVDWGASINSLTVNQYLRSLNEYRTLKSMYVLGDEKKIQDDLFNDFCEYYQYHDSREVEIWYDNMGNQRTGNTNRTRAEQARDLLLARGWKPRLMTSGLTNPQHGLKHLLWEAIFQEKNTLLPRYRMNKDNCRELYLSMRNAKTVTGRYGETKKDKSSERSTRIPRQEATDLSDANDAPIFGKFYSLLRYQNSTLPDPRVSRS